MRGQDDSPSRDLLGLHFSEHLRLINAFSKIGLHPIQGFNASLSKGELCLGIEFQSLLQSCVDHLLSGIQRFGLRRSIQVSITKQILNLLDMHIEEARNSMNFSTMWKVVLPNISHSTVFDNLFIPIVRLCQTLSKFKQEAIVRHYFSLFLEKTYRNRLHMLCGDKHPGIGTLKWFVMKWSSKYCDIKVDHHTDSFPTKFFNNHKP